MRAASAALLAAATLAACGDNNPAFELEAGCQPLLAGHHCALPYPSDFFRVEDPSTATGYRIEMTAAAHLETNQGASANVHEVVPADGFSHIPTIVAVLPDEVSAAGLVHLTGRIEDSLAADARTIILGEDGERVPHYVDLDPRAAAPTRQAIVIHPVVGLKPGLRYVVALRGIERPDGGTAAAAEGFRRLRDGEAGGAAPLQALAPHYEQAIFPLLEEAGWARGELQLAWDFTVGSREAPIADMLRVRELTLAWLADNEPVVAIEEVVEDPTELVWRQVRGTVTGPLFMTADEPGALLARGEDGQVVQSGTASFPFLVQIPASLREEQDPGAALAYGHGFFGSTDELEGMSTQMISGELGAVLFGIDWVGMSSDDLASVLLDLSGEPARTVEFGERVHQAMANWLVFAAAIQGPLAEAPELQREGGELIYAPEPLTFLGISQGHILGGTMAALNPRIERIALSVGGAGFTHLMLRANAFEAFLVILDGLLEDPIDIQLFVASLQTAFDRFDPASYAHLYAEPLPDVPADRPMLMHMGLGDIAVPNLGTLLHARLLGLSVTEPSPVDPFGLEPATPPLEGGRALTIWDFGLDTAAIYQDPIPPSGENVVHEGVRVQPGAIAQLRELLATGTIIHPCQGPCDPD